MQVIERSQSFDLRVVVHVVVEVQKFPRLSESVLVVTHVPFEAPPVISVTSSKQWPLHLIEHLPHLSLNYVESARSISSNHIVIHLGLNV